LCQHGLGLTAIMDSLLILLPSRQPLDPRWQKKAVPPHS